MNRLVTWIAGLFAAAALGLPGCIWPAHDASLRDGHVPVSHDDHYHAVATQIEVPELAGGCLDEPQESASPMDVDATTPGAYWDLTLEEAIAAALKNSKVLRDLGATIIRSPQSMGTIYEPAIVETSPLFGVEAALSNFDASVMSSAFFEKIDRRLNDRVFGESGILIQDLGAFRTQIAKRSVTGSEFTVRHNVGYDANNAPTNQFGSAWDTNFEAEARHPLLQGGGVQFNRIAGPLEGPGVLNGVLIARVNTDISLADFELSLRDFVSNVQNAYWDLYFAYRDLDAKVDARNRALEVWQRIKSGQVESGVRAGSEQYNEAQARAQYFRFEQEVRNALDGRLLQRTTTNNGSSGGTFRGVGGVRVAERRLRLMMGMPITDCRLIRPADEPVIAPIGFDWHAVMHEALCRRADLRRQRWQIKHRELQMIANKNFLLPSLDVVGRYRWRGFGKDLISSRPGNKPEFDNAFADLTSGDFQEWQLGLELSAPIGFRRAHSAVKNARLQLARERAVLAEQQRQVIHDLSNAVAEVQRAFDAAEAAYNNLDASREQLESYQDTPEPANPAAITTRLFLLLDFQRSLAEAQARFYEAQVDYMLAVRAVHFEKGTLLEHCGVYLSEGPWPHGAYADAARRETGRSRPVDIDYRICDPPVSRGPRPHHAPVPPFADEPAAEEVPAVPIEEPSPPAAPEDLPLPLFPDGDSAS